MLIKEWTHLRAVLATVFALLVAASATLLFLPRAEAADCGGWAGGISHSWQVTPASAQRDSAGFCEPGFRCEEWCQIVCDEVEPQGIFRCVPEPG